MTLISGVPTNIITGFLGVGKTSTILHLLKSKPKEERWAILVNEFGEIGIDGALYEGQYSQEQGVYIREVPGGCMCCTAGLPMQVALSQLLKRAKPDRLLIEPTGLGHPTEVLQTLNSEHFRGVLTIEKIVTLIDARSLSDQRYVDHETFQEQIAIADVIVSNKQDLCSANDKALLQSYLNERSLSDATLVFTQHGVIETSLLQGPTSMVSSNSADVHLNTALVTQALDAGIPECGYLSAVNQKQGFHSIGWRFTSRFQFDRNKLFAFLSGIDAKRVKAVFMTSSGSFGYNLTQDALSEFPLEPIQESKIEIIAHELNPEWEPGLFTCISDQSHLDHTARGEQNDSRA